MISSIRPYSLASSALRKKSRSESLLTTFFFSSRRRHTRLQGDWRFRRVLFRSRSRSLKLLVCAPICTPAMTEFGGVEATSDTAAAAASLPKSRLEYTGFTSLSLPTYHAAPRARNSPVVMFGFSANRSAAADDSQSHGSERTQ